MFLVYITFQLGIFFKHIDPEQKITIVQFKIHKVLIYYILISIESRMLRVDIYAKIFAYKYKFIA